MEKTNVMRMLDQAKIDYTPHEFSGLDLVSHSPDLAIYKTLVTMSSDEKNNYVCVIPLEHELDLKKAAKAAGEKKIKMLHLKDLLKTTGYQRGGCSPIGMVKQFPTAVDKSALDHETIAVSAGKVGVSIEIAPRDLEKMIPLKYYDLIQED